MTLELMVFVPDDAPVDPDDFFDWFDEQTEWDEDHSYRDVHVSAPALQAWFAAMVVEFPVLDVKRRSGRDTEYSFGRSMIHALFPHDAADDALSMALAIAETHRLGVFEASSDDGTIWRPDPYGTLKRQ